MKSERVIVPADYADPARITQIKDVHTDLTDSTDCRLKTKGAGLDAKRLCDNFMASWRKPFGAVVLAEMTGVSVRIAEKYLAVAEELGEVKAVGDGVYLVRRNDIILTAWNWKYSRSCGEAVLMVLKGGSGRSIRAIAREMGFSRQYVYKYLEALASVGAVRWDGKQYVATGVDDLRRLGAVVEKGILSRMKREAKGEG